MLVDRTELEQQLFRNLRECGITHCAEAFSKAELRRLLAADQRGLIVSMIHKFEGTDADLSTRDNIVVLVDEAHRTTGGDLGNYLLGALPNATYIVGRGGEHVSASGGPGAETGRCHRSCSGDPRYDRMWSRQFHVGTHQRRQWCRGLKRRDW
jgi:type I restriction enzyme R subunit